MPRKGNFETGKEVHISMDWPKICQCLSYVRKIFNQFHENHPTSIRKYTKVGGQNET